MKRTPLHFSVQYGGHLQSNEQKTMLKPVFNVDSNNRERKFRKNTDGTFHEHKTSQIDVDCYGLTAEQAGAYLAKALYNPKFPDQVYDSVEIEDVEERWSDTKYGRLVAKWWEPVVEETLVPGLEEWLTLENDRVLNSKSREIELLEARLAQLKKGK